MLKHLDLFSGIGGFALAARWAGMETIGFSEIEPYACKILKRHWPDVPNYGDIRAMHGQPCDLITGGFPCQPYSTAGHQRGAGDNRALWPEMLRIIAESRPSWVLAENVAGFARMGLDELLADMEGIGYTCGAAIIPAASVGAPHERKRVWAIAYCDDEKSDLKEGEEWKAYERPIARWPELWAGRHPWEVALTYNSGVDDGISNRMDRVRGLGNAIVPAVAYEILKAINYQHAHV